ncbi:glutathione synthase [Pseudochelatococcus lubricantis]|uniref:Glutathione synthase n=1 Tax=Pseudochelatococcus lubricantis TaxID=1538102 RepID=A0ABX0V3K9_9HYPH|nr:glutathione synthetase [Pseudochelatococcus lubricantis]NIJ59738.1 glutathione synthase [Pseudochelatococcus lubricantis]
MRIAFFVNAIEGESPLFTTSLLAAAALSRDHEVIYVTPDDFTLRPDGALVVHAKVLPSKKFKKPETFHAALQDESLQRRTIEIGEIDALLLRNDPSLDLAARPWAAHAGILFGRFAAQRGVVVLNDPEALALAQNKLYFESFPDVVRPPALISRNIDEIRHFVESHPKGAILKPLQGSGRRNVFKVNSASKSNLNKVFEAVGVDGYIVAQPYLPEAKAGGIRLFLLNGQPLKHGDTYAALRRMPARGDQQSNICAIGAAAPARITDDILALAERVRPKLVADGVFLVGLDIVGDKLLEVNVFSPGGLWNMRELYGVDFSNPIIRAVENKVAAQAVSKEGIDNRMLATL